MVVQSKVEHGSEEVGRLRQQLIEASKSFELKELQLQEQVKLYEKQKEYAGVLE